MAMRIIHISVLSVIIVLLASFSASADFYKYVDENGVVHLTNEPRPGYSWMMEEGSHGAASARSADKPMRRVDKRDLDEIIYMASVRYGIDPALVRAVVKAESDYDVLAVSAVGARGLMQLMPETARRMGVVDIHDPADNIEGGTRYLSSLLEMFDWKVPLALAAYNAGENAVIKYGGVPPYDETRGFVKKVLDYYRVYRVGR